MLSYLLLSCNISQSWLPNNSHTALRIVKPILFAGLLTLSLPLFAAEPAYDNYLPASPASAGINRPVAHIHHVAANDHEIGGAGQGYTNVDGNRVHSPVHSSSRPPEATAKCRDGSWSFSQHHRGTCSHHGGVESW